MLLMVLFVHVVLDTLVCIVKLISLVALAVHVLTMVTVMTQTQDSIAIVLQVIFPQSNEYSIWQIRYLNLNQNKSWASDISHKIMDVC